MYSGRRLCGDRRGDRGYAAAVDDPEQYLIPRRCWGIFILMVLPKPLGNTTFLFVQANQSSR